MLKIDHAGIEVSSKELIVALRRDGELKPWKSFPNTPGGNQAIVRYLARKGHQVQVCLESRWIYGLDLALALHAAPEMLIEGAQPVAAARVLEECLEAKATLNY